MSDRHFLMLVYRAFGGELEGGTLFQKRMYFLGLRCKKEFGWIPHYYGPYSPSVTDTNCQLYTLGFLSKTTTSAPGPAIYRLIISPEFVNDVINKHSEEWKRISAAVDSLKDLTQTTLVIAAKVHSITKGTKDRNAIEHHCRKVSTICGTSKKEEIEQAITLLCSDEI